MDAEEIALRALKESNEAQEAAHAASNELRGHEKVCAFRYETIQKGMDRHDKSLADHKESLTSMQKSIREDFKELNKLLTKVGLWAIASLFAVVAWQYQQSSSSQQDFRETVMSVIQTMEEKKK